MRRDLADLGIDIGLLMPDRLLMHAAIRQTDYAVEVGRAYNRWLVEEWLADDTGLHGAVLAPHHLVLDQILVLRGHEVVLANPHARKSVLRNLPLSRPGVDPPA